MGGSYAILHAIEGQNVLISWHFTFKRKKKVQINKLTE